MCLKAVVCGREGEYCRRHIWACRSVCGWAKLPGDLLSFCSCLREICHSINAQVLDWQALTRRFYHPTLRSRRSFLLTTSKTNRRLGVSLLTMCHVICHWKMLCSVCFSIWQVFVWERSCRGFGFSPLCISTGRFSISGTQYINI